MEEKKTLGKKILDEVIDIAKIFIICFVVIYLLTNFIAKPIRVEGSSMYPTLKDGELGITNVFGVKFQSVDRYDVAIIYNEERKEHWVKRVIGLPNDVVEAKDDILYINGEAVDQSFLDASYVNEMKQNCNCNFTSDFGPITLGDDEYWLMGDNRVRSEDSRVHGPFKEEELVGKDVVILFPFDEIKIVHNDGDA